MIKYNIQLWWLWPFIWCWNKLAKKQAYKSGLSKDQNIKNDKIIFNWEIRPWERVSDADLDEIFGP